MKTGLHVGRTRFNENWVTRWENEVSPHLLYCLVVASFQNCIRLPHSQALPWGTGESLGMRLGIRSYSVRVYGLVMMLSMFNCTQILEGMSEKIRMGIEAAQTDLSKEKEKKQQEEVNHFLQCSGVKATSLCYVVCVTRFLQGLLRYVPIVGSVLSWFSPPTPTTPEGRTFSLSSGLWDVQ